MRFTLTEEPTKNGRKTEIQYCLFDTLTNTVIARFGNPDVVQSIISRYEAAQMAAELGETA